MTPTLTRLRTTPLRADTHFGAEIHDIDLRTADDATRRAVVEEFHRSGAILIRGQACAPRIWSHSSRCSAFPKIIPTRPS